jgi:dipeptidyl aminopeptidase/acylaminoacyl peptidase
MQLAPTANLRSMGISRRARKIRVATALAVALHCAAPASAATPNPLTAFTVKDSIEISYITNPTMWTVNQDPAVAPIISPDQRYFLLVTQRGLLSSNSIESTIWLFDRNAVLDYVARRTTVRPTPRAIATLQATSNMAVISDVRWLSDSKRIAFLGREAGSPQLFVADLSGSTRAVTKVGTYVSAYDVAGDTIVYTTLLQAGESKAPRSGLVEITGQTIFSLLWPDKNSDDLAESHLVKVPSTLHVQRNGKEVPISFTMDGRPLRLFFPVLSLSPDGRSLITIAPVHAIPAHWEAYQPWFGWSELSLKPDNKWAVAEENAWKASQEVVIDLQTGRLLPLVDAPAGRSLFFISAPTKAIWSRDSRRVLVSNTFLPMNVELGAADRMQRSLAPAVALIDVSSRKVQPVAYLEQPPHNSRPTQRVSDVVWNDLENEIDLTYASSPDNVPLPGYDTYRLRSGNWVKTEAPVLRPEGPREEVALYIHQDLNQAPVLAAKLPGTDDPLIIWYPNPQLRSMALGRASLYHWRDKDGNLWAGILVLPPGYRSDHRYPLVIQTHGYEPLKFFADGRYTTGSGGRALCSRGIVVLQMDQPITYFDTPKEGPFQTGGFESAIAQLDADGLIDPHRVGIIGFSFTCFHVLYALIHKPSLFAAASITDGNNMSYLQYLLWTDIPEAQEYAEKLNGGVPFGAGLLKWATTAPGFNSDEIRTPLLISALEKGALVGQWEIYAGLRRLKKPVDMLWLSQENAPHVLVQPQQRYLSQQAAVDWFDFWLNGAEDAEPSKANRYERWRELRRMRGQKENEAPHTGDRP